MKLARVALSVLIGGVLVTGVSAPASAAVSTACTQPWQAGSLSSGVTLSVAEADGTVVSADGSGYRACIFPNGDAYSIVIGTVDAFGTLVEDMGAANRDRIFTLGFTLPEGQSAASAELYARVSSYTVGANGRDVTLVMQPVAFTSGSNDPEPQPLQDRIANITGGIRYNSAGQSRGVPKMWIGATASSYVVSLSGSCPNWNTGLPSGSKQAGAISVRMRGPHMTAGTLAAPVVNKGFVKAFIPTSAVTACFGVSTVAEVVNALSVTRTDGSAETALVAGTGFVSTEVEGGLLVSVPEITFSNPEYTIKSTLSAYLAGAGGSTSGGSTSGGTTTGGSTTGGTTSGGTTTGGSSSSSSASYKIVKKGSKATITIVLVAAATVKIYRKTSASAVAKLAKSLSGKKGTNTYVTTWKTGYVYIVRSSKGTTLATLK
jgi:hypothetical protein